MWMRPVTCVTLPIKKRVGGWVFIFWGGGGGGEGDVSMETGE